LNNPLFRSIEQDETIQISQSCTTQPDATWGLNRVSERAVELDGNYLYDADGALVDSYIIDTGILVSHSEFAGGRAIWGATFTGDNNNNDCNGHGTHVAGTVGGTLYGMAKKTTLIAVKVLNCQGSGSYEGVMAGVQWTAQEAQRRNRPSTANMSLGGGRHAGLNAAVDAAVDTGVSFAVAAGNNNGDACNTSPASASKVICVGSTDVTGTVVQQDVRSSFSNYGICTHIFAPGSLITSAWSDGGIRTISGTSMAAPHVCGAASLYLHKHPDASPATVRAALEDHGTQDIINLACNGVTACLNSPNTLLHSACEL